jgi:8-oxo-dGTP pyrophosphatase MutT (NUDIX family)
MDQPLQTDSIPAATVVVFRRAEDGGAPELLMITRSRAMAFAGGAAVFPGGRVDPADRALAERAGAGDADEAAHRIAAIRETLEETGLAIGVTGAVTADQARRARAMLLEHGDLAPVLSEMEWSLDLDSLVPFARWHPKNERLPRVFDTRFYIADLGTGAVEVEIDATENTRLFWVSAAEALARTERGELALIYPTRRNLERLAQFASFAEARAHAEAIPVRTITPWMEQRDGAPWLAIPADAGYPIDGEPLTSLQRG